MDKNTKFRALVAEYCEKANITYQQLADRARMSRAYLYRLMDGLGSASPELEAAIVHAMPMIPPGRVRAALRSDRPVPKKPGRPVGSRDSKPRRRSAKRAVRRRSA